MREACYDIFPSVDDAENRYNCLERYGKLKTKDYCLEFTKANHPIFYYPLKNKYTCLTTVNSDFLPVLVAQEVTDCINEYYDYPTERCLE